MSNLSVATPSVRTVRLALPLNADNRNGVITITSLGQVTEYHVDRVGANCFELSQIGDGGCDAGKTYHVHAVGKAGMCECTAWMRWAKCRHVDAVRALQTAGKL